MSEKSPHPLQPAEPALPTSHASSRSWRCNSKQSRCWNPCFQISVWSGIRIANDRCRYPHLLFFSSAPGCTKLALLIVSISETVGLGYEQWAAPFTCVFRTAVSQWWVSLAVVTNQPAHFNAESAWHAFPPCSQVFAFSEANLHIRQAASNRCKSHFSCCMAACFPLHVFLSLRGYDNMSHIVFINITCFLDLAAVSARQHTGKKHFSLAQPWFALCWFPEQEKRMPARLELPQSRSHTSGCPWNSFNKGGDCSFKPHVLTKSFLL